MNDVRALAARQHNCFSRRQLVELGIGNHAINHRLQRGDWIALHDGVYAIAPASKEPRTRWMAATLTDGGSVLSHASAAALWGWWDRPRVVEFVTRPGSGGPCRHDGVWAYRSERLIEDTTERLGIPLTRVPRTLLDLTSLIDTKLLARCVRESIRLGTTTTVELIDALAGPHRGRRGTRRLSLTVARYSGLPLERARSGAEVLALEILRDAGRLPQRFNRKVAGAEADLIWPSLRLIIEIDGGDYHQDRGEDARKEALWRAAGYEVKRVPADRVRTDLLTVAPNVAQTRL